MHDERGLVVLVLGVIADDELATDLLGPQVLRPPGRVVRDHRVGGVEDPLRRPVVLVEHDHRRLGERLLEPHQVPVVRPAEPVHRVVGDDPAGHEVVRLLDVEVVDLRVELDGSTETTRSNAPFSFTITMPGSTAAAGVNGRSVLVAPAPRLAARRAVYSTSTSSTARICSTVSAISAMSALTVSNRQSMSRRSGRIEEAELLLEDAATFLVAAEQLDAMEGPAHRAARRTT